MRRPRTEPLYSQRSRIDFPISDDYVKVSLHYYLLYLRKKYNVCLKSLCVIGEDQFYGVFEKADNSREEEYFKCNNLEGFRERAESIWQQGTIIKTLIMRSDGTFLGQSIRLAGVSQSLISTAEIDDNEVPPGICRIDACFYQNSKFWFLVSHHPTTQKPQRLTLLINDSNPHNCWQQYIWRYNKPVSCSCLVRNKQNITSLLVVREDDEEERGNIVRQGDNQTTIFNPTSLFGHFIGLNTIVQMPLPLFIFPTAESEIFKIPLHP